MVALPGSLPWLFLLVYFACGQILDITPLDTTDVSKKGLDDFAKATTHKESLKNEEEEKENKTQLATEYKNDDSQSTNKPAAANETNSESDITWASNRTALSDPLGRNNRRRGTNRLSSASNATGFPMMSQERRNSYLSIAERRKYYNRTRVQTKRVQTNDVELEYQETVSKPVASSTETLQVNEIRVIKKPTNKDSSKEVTTDRNQTSNQRVFFHFPANETQGKPQSTRQSVIQSQYQFGQKLNQRKSVQRAQDVQEERLKRKKEKSRLEGIMENSTSKLNKNYPTQSTKLIRVDKNIWPTTTIPRADADNENFVTHSHENATVLEKLVGYVTGNDTQKAFFNEVASRGEDDKNRTKVPQNNSFTPLPLNNLNVTGERTNNSAEEEKISSVIRDVYNQEILKLNNSQIENENFSENPMKIHFNYNTTANNTQSRPTAQLGATVLGALNNVTQRTPTSSGGLNATATAFHVRNGKFSNHESEPATQPTILKSNFKEKFHEMYQTTTPFVKAISKEPSATTSKVRFAQSEVNTSTTNQTKEKPRNGASGLAAGENGSKAEEYPLTIELNENNKRVLSEMFQTVTTSKPKQQAKGEATASLPKHQDISRNKSTTVESSTPATQSTPLPTTNATVRSETTPKTTEGPRVMPPTDFDEDHKAQGTRYNTKFYISPKFNGSQVIKVVEDDDENEDVDAQSRSAGVAIYVLAAFGLIPLLLALVFGTKYMMQRNQREYECESDAKSDVSGVESQIKEGKKKKGSTDLKKSPSNVTTITLVTATRLPRVQHWENSEKQGNRNWEFPRSGLKLKTILGQGNFGQVWKAEAEDMPGHEGVTRLVAVKTVKEGATEKEHTEFIKELEIMQQIGSHPNIVTLLGCCTDQEPYYLIMEYVKYGKLLTYLREHRVNENYYNFSNNSDALTSRDLTVFAYCVARGMEYLASRGIIHRDLAARNVLVDQNKLCKIADFGMSRSVRDFENGQVYEERQQKGALPIRWMAPESLVYSVFTYKSDVWSFGIVMWEIVTLGSTPYPNMGAREVMRKVRDGYRLERPSHCKPEFYRLISYCWAHDPNKRPDFSELRHELGNLLDNPTKDGSYVDLDRFAVDNSFHVSTKTNDFRLLERNDFKTLQKLGDWGKKDWPDDMKKARTKKGRNNGKGTVTLTGQGSFTVNSRILEKEFKII